RNRAVGRQAQHVRQQIQHEHPEHDDRAMGEVDDIHHAPDQRQAHGCEAIDRTDEDAVDNRSKNPDHLEGTARRLAAASRSGPIQYRTSAVLAASGQITSLTSLPSFFCHWASTMSCAICRPCSFGSVENLVRPNSVVASILPSSAATLSWSVEP